MKRTGERLLAYFERRAAEEGGAWNRNATIAREWLLLLDMSDPPSQRVRKFVETLNSADIRAGSAWDELQLWATKWRDMLNEQGPGGQTSGPT